MRWVVLVVCVACSKPSAPAPHDAAAPVAAPVVAAEEAGIRVWPVWTPRIENEEEFLHYATAVGDDRYLKLVVDLHTQKTYYVDSALYPLHKDFVFAELTKTKPTPEAVREVDRNYGKNKPDFLMLYVVHHQKQDLWTLAFWEGDKATAAHVRQAFASVRATFYQAAEMKFRPCSNDQEAVAREVAAEYPSISNSELFKTLAYQSFHEGVAVGKLRIVHGNPENALFAPDEIVVLPEPLTDITPVAGIISESHSTPLSHVNIRAASWDIPNAGILDASRTYAALDGKIVRYEAKRHGAEVRIATAAEIASAKKKATRTAVQVPKADLEVGKLATLAELRVGDAPAYGQKTANLGEIVGKAPAGVRVPPGFGIPIRHYAEHLAANGLGADIEALLGDPRVKADAAVRRASLAKVRSRIRAAPLAPGFVKMLETALAGLGADAGASPGVFVRSSTNAEDLAGFSGAGLYDTVANVHGVAAVGEAVKQVWASVWNLAAYDERELYRVDPRSVYGAVLVQVGVPATAAGVLVTAHPTDPKDTHSITINAKSGLGMRVVDGKKVPEIVVYNTFNKGLRVVSRSDETTMLVFSADGGVREVPNPSPGEPILTNERVVKLATAARALQEIFPRDKPLDIEWVFRDAELFVVQSRPFRGGPR